MFNFVVPGWSLISNPVHYEKAGSRVLVITVGDSWTYGDSLGNTKVRLGRDDSEYRLKHVYGSIIKTRLNADWLNIALPGGSNTLMLDWLSAALSELKYTQIICFVTLTESGRHEDLQLVDYNLNSQQHALGLLLDATYRRINDLKTQFPDVEFIVGHNFTDGRLPMLSWLEVLTGQQIQNDTFIVVSEHIQQMNYTKTFSDVLDVIDKAAARIDILDNCQYCCKEDSRHPNEQGHMMWAEYLLSQYGTNTKTGS